jgi:hypothetical protein
MKIVEDNYKLGKMTAGKLKKLLKDAALIR